jgi:hypothetical protein
MGIDIPSFILGKEKGGSSDVLAADIVDRSVKSVYLPNVQLIGLYAFRECTKLESASFPKATKVNAYSFVNCYNLITVYLPEVTSIGTSAFSNCSRLSEITVGFASTAAAAANAPWGASPPAGVTVHYTDTDITY